MKRLRQIITPGKLVAFVTVLVIAIAVIVTGQAIFSPGPLNTQGSGRELGGVYSHGELSRQCGACHASPGAVATMADRCLECHTDVATELQDSQALHSQMLANAVPWSCTQKCHTEHNGPEAALTLVEGYHFADGGQVFSLQGHARKDDGSAFTCADCHTEAPYEFEEQTCESCHSERESEFTSTHVDTFGHNCLECHDGIDTFGADFDHNKAPFPLQGQHALLSCTDCHQGAQTIVDLKSIPMDCYFCHEQDNIHSSNFGLDCADCHNTAGWTPAQYNLPHTFPLNHHSANGECAQCHPVNLLDYTCYAGCHKHTPKKMEDNHREVANFGDDCALCHPTGRE